MKTTPKKCGAISTKSTQGAIDLDQKHARRILAGKKAKSAGEHFEHRLDVSFAELARRGEGLVEKTPEPMRPIKALGGGRFVAVYEKHAQPDYKGTIAGGRTVLFEAKYCGADRIERSRVTAKQAEYLSKIENLGAAAFVLAGFSDGEVFRIPWSFFDGMELTFGHKHIKREELERWPWRVLTDRLGFLMLFDDIGAEEAELCSGPIS